MSGLMCLLCCLLLGFVSIVEAIPREGSCVGFSFPLQSDNKTVDSILVLRVLRHEAEVYQEAASSLGYIHLPFGEFLEPIAVSEAHDRGRIQIRKIANKEALGWMKREDLLCRNTPLLNDKELERKLFIRIPPAKASTSGVISAYPVPQGSECFNRCKLLSRFELYFIFVEDPESKRYLLADQYRLDENSALVGWVEMDAGIPWDTTLGLRPAEQDGTQIHIAPELKEAAEQKGTIILGGKDWYKYPMHIPLLDLREYQSKQYFYIAAPGVGVRSVEGFSDSTASEELKQAFEGFQAPPTLEELKRVDVFIVLDGTFSMEPYIKEARKVAQAIVEAFSNTASYKESSARFGFRVYRDEYAGNHGVGEGLGLSTDCNPSYESMRANQNKFNQEIAKVKASSLDQVLNDGYPENLFYGLRQAILDMARAC